MRRLLTLWLVISLLGYSSVWAMDLHGAASGADQTAQQSLDVDSGAMDPQADHANEADCDHCCHGMSHLIALSADGISAVPKLGNDTHGSVRVLFLSHTLSPDLRPPIA